MERGLVEEEQAGGAEPRRWRSRPVLGGCVRAMAGGLNGLRAVR